MSWEGQLGSLAACTWRSPLFSVPVKYIELYGLLDMELFVEIRFWYLGESNIYFLQPMHLNLKYNNNSRYQT